MSPVYSPVCTCNVDGISGCAKHPATIAHPETVQIARTINTGGAFTDADAVRVADAFLFLIDDGATP